MNELSAKTLIITGASRGIGRALALRLVEAGANLILNARHAGPLNEVAAECTNLGASVIALSGSAADRMTASKLVKAALDLGQFHGFIQVAGVLHPGPFLWELSEAYFREIFAANVMVSYQMIRFAVPGIVEARWRPGGFLRFRGCGEDHPGYCRLLCRQSRGGAHGSGSLLWKLRRLPPSSTGLASSRPACSSRPAPRKGALPRSCGRPSGASKNGANCSRRRNPQKPSSLSSRPIPGAFMAASQPGGMGLEPNAGIRSFRSLPSSSLGTQVGKLQLSVSLQEQVASIRLTKLEPLSTWQTEKPVSFDYP